MAKGDPSVNDILDFIQKEAEIEREEVIDQNYDYWVELRKKGLRELGKTEKEIAEEVQADREKRAKKSKAEEYQAEIDRLKKLSKEAATEEDRRKHKQQVRDMENARKIADTIAAGISNAIGSMYNKITESANFYGKLIGQMETRLIGSGKTYASVSDMVSKAFAVSPFFSMQTVMEKTAKMVEAGIAYNVELRASMAVIAEKVANTFDAFDSTLLRLIRIQQQDSTQARLGMENALTRFLNSQFKDTSYLSSGSSDSVSAALIEAMAHMDRNTAVEYEYSAQKWLGSMSSVGVSDATIQKLAQGLGYLGSGDITGLSSNASLQQLLVASANQSGGRSYGEILSSGATTKDISDIFQGFHSLISEVSKTENIVALNQYASVFGLTMSDLASVMNLTTKDIQTITGDMKSYSEAIQIVRDETSFKTLWSRSSGAEIAENLIGNLIGNVGQNIGSSAGGYIAWSIAGMVNEFLSGIDTGIEFSPFGVGGSLDLSLGDITQAVTVMAAMMSGLPAVFQGLSSIGGINWSGLEDVDNISRGGGLSSIREGSNQSGVTFVGNTNESTIFESSLANTDSTASKVTDVDMDAEKEKTQKMQDAIYNIDDNVAFMVQMMNSSGIVIRGNAGETGTDSFFKGLLVGHTSR